MKAGTQGTKENTANPYPHEEKILLLLTIIIGAVVGLVVVAFILLTERLGSRLYPAGGAAWRRLVIPVAGALGTGYLLFRYFPNARGSGIPQTKTALFLREGYISLRTVVGKFSLCSVSLASGIALGREGPSVHVGAGIASVLGRRLGLSPASIKALVPVGASAALAAAFNTPIAAVLFSLEEVMGDMHAPVLGSIVLSSATSWMVLHLLLGDEPLFHVPAYQLVHPVEFVFYAVLGVVGGLVSVAFVKLLLWLRQAFKTLPPDTQWLQPIAGGLTVGILGWFFPDVLGVGYGIVSQALNGQIVIGAMALLVCLKVVATATCYSSGNAGGIFGPSLFMGAMMGGTVGGIAHMLMPDYTGSVGAYALVGMGAAFAGVVRVPLTSVIMIFEITRDYSIIVPLMISNLMAYFISSRLQEEPIYEALQHQDGIHLPSGAKAREALLMVAHAYRPGAAALPANATIQEAASAVDRERGASPVVDAVGLRGLVTAAKLEEALRDGKGDEQLKTLVPAPPARLDFAHFPHLHPDHVLDVAMRRIADSGMNVLPVVSRSNTMELLGVISLQDILAAYGIGKPRDAVELPAQPASAPRQHMLAGIVAVMLGLAVVIAVLNYTYRAERAARSQQHYKSGIELLAKERYEEAIEQFRDALSISHSTAHRLALAAALEKAGRLGEASIYWNEVLREQPSSGPANLGIARWDVREGAVQDAVTHYQRAIYGSWPERAAENRIQTRIELVEMLRKAGQQTRAQAELLGLAASTPEDPALEKQVGHMLADLGMPRQAGDMFRRVLARNPRDAGAAIGAADAEFAREDYRAARDAYRAVLKIDPSDAAAVKRADMCDRILVLDPQARGVSSAERYRRSREILSDVVTEAQPCGVAAADLQAAQAALAKHGRPASFGDAADEHLSLAERLWTKLPKSCAGDEALGLILSRLAR